MPSSDRLPCRGALLFTSYLLLASICSSRPYTPADLIYDAPRIPSKKYPAVASVLIVVNLAMCSRANVRPAKSGNEHAHAEIIPYHPTMTVGCAAKSSDSGAHSAPQNRQWGSNSC